MQKRMKKRNLFLVLVLILAVFFISTAQADAAAKVTAFVPKQPFGTPYGVAVDSEGNVYVADTGDNRIQKLDSTGAFLIKWGESGSDPGQFTTPSGVAVDSAGNVYVADAGNNRIQKFTSMGAFLIEWGEYGTGDGQFRNPIGVAVDDGNVYVADTGNHRIQKFDSTGAFLIEWGEYGTGDSQFKNPGDVAVDSAGNVYVADIFNHRIQKFTSGGAFTIKWGGSGTGDGQFDLPAGVAVDGDENVYVADVNNNRIQKFTSGGAFTIKWGSEGDGTGEFSDPGGVAVDSEGNVYVADTQNSRIQKFTSGGAFTIKWEVSGSDDGQFKYPSGVAVGDDGNVYVADRNNYRIQKFDSTGDFLTKWGDFGAGDGQFAVPRAVAVDSAGNVYVADAHNNRIQKFTSTGGFLTKWGSTGIGDSQFDLPAGVAVDSAGNNVYVADAGNNRIQKFTSTGAFLIEWGESGAGDGQFDLPYGVAVDSAGNVYVADTGNYRIQKFTSTGAFIVKWGGSGSGDGQFDLPYGVAVGSAGNVYVADTDNDQIQKFESDGDFIAKWGESGRTGGQFSGPVSVAVDNGGKVYVAEAGNHRIQVSILAPGAPVLPSATAGNGQATVSFTPPVDNGGSAITGYTVTSNPGGITAAGDGATITVTGLSNGTAYTFTVTASNAAGTGPASTASNTVIPYGPSGGGSSGRPASTGVDILVNGKAETAAVATITREGGKTVTTVVVDDKKVAERLEQEGSNAVVAIPVGTGADVVVGTLNGQTIKNMESKEAILEIRTGQVTYTLPASQINIDAVSEQLGRQAELKDIAVSVKISEPAADTVKLVEDTANKNNYQIMVKPIEFEITCSSGNNTVEVSRFNAYVERMVAIPEGVDPSRITTGIILNSDGTFSHVPTAITMIDGKYYAKLNSLTNSTYSLIYSPKTFKDIEKHWAKEAVGDMASRLVLNGAGEDRFEPDRDITRAEFAVIAVRALGLMRPGTGRDTFSDVVKGAYYYDAVSIAYEYGIISGYGNGKFEPDDRITREQAMTMIARAMKITRLEAGLEDSEASEVLAGFTDANNAAAYAKTGIAACVKAGIVSGRSKTDLVPKDNMTRAEVAVVVRSLLQKSGLI